MCFDDFANGFGLFGKRGIVRPVDFKNQAGADRRVEFELALLGHCRQADIVDQFGCGRNDVLLQHGMDRVTTVVESAKKHLHDATFGRQRD